MNPLEKAKNTDPLAILVQKGRMIYPVKDS
jgi:hypothetical protein